jgi:hypothetical protein
MIDVLTSAGFELVHSDKIGADEPDFAGLGFPPWSTDIGYYFGPAGADTKSLTKSLVEERGRIKRAPNKIQVSELYGRLAALLQSPAHLDSRDEKFLRFCTKGAMTKGEQVA